MDLSAALNDMAFKVFVTGTGTNVGKTVVSTALAQGLADLGLRPYYWKPIQTGNGESDSLTLQTTLADRITIVPELISYALAASPDQAAAAEGEEGPSVTELTQAWHALPTGFVIIEGAGGLLVPLNAQGETWADLLHAVNVPVLVVATTGLGTLNHTLLTLDALSHRGLDLFGLVMSGEAHPANIATLRRMRPTLPVHALGPVLLDDAPEERVDEARKLAQFCLRQAQAFKDARHDNEWILADKQHVWHPYTQHKLADPPLPVVRAQGVYLETQQGERLVDGASSWWVNNAGHGRIEIGSAIARQQQTLDHVIFAGATHKPGASLAAQLSDMLGYGLNRVFYSDNGSTAVEVALKMTYQAWVNRGEAGRRTFLSFSGSYHGDTFGAMAVGATDEFHGVFRPLLFKTLRADIVTEHPSTLCPSGMAALDERLLAFETMVRQHQHELAAVILEPLLQGSAGMLMQPKRFVQEVARICKAYQLPLIFDEVFTGFGRLGASFACERAEVTPDLICLAKGLTGGTLPLAATVAREEFFTAFLRDDRAQALLHGHSFTANPIACSAALAALKIMREEDLAHRARILEHRYHEWISTHEERLGLEHARAMGGVLAFELSGSGTGSYFHPKAASVSAVARQHGIFLRPLGNTVYFMPPLVIAPGELEFALGALARTVHDLNAPGI